jgi:predicted nucleic acid-binding protein
MSLAGALYKHVMNSIFFDASTLVDRYVEEDGTEFVNLAFQLLPIERVTCSTLSILEIISLLARKRNAGRIDQHEFEEAFDAFNT